jgi:hypothetical protein
MHSPLRPVCPLRPINIPPPTRRLLSKTPPNSLSGAVPMKAAETKRRSKKNKKIDKKGSSLFSVE